MQEIKEKVKCNVRNFKISKFWKRKNLYTRRIYSYIIFISSENDLYMQKYRCIKNILRAIVYIF